MYDVPPYWDVQACTGSVSYAVTATATGVHWQPLTNLLDSSSEDRSDSSLHLSYFRR